jgi:hypothetical protein
MFALSLALPDYGVASTPIVKDSSCEFGADAPPC